MFECVLSDVLGGEKLCRKEGICRVEAGLVARRPPTACRRRVAGELQRLRPYCLPDGNFLDCLALVVGEVATVGSADWKNPLLMMRAACDSRAQRIVIGRALGLMKCGGSRRAERCKEIVVGNDRTSCDKM